MKSAKFGEESSLFFKLWPLTACALALAGRMNADFVSQGVDPLYSFSGGADGANPGAALMQATGGSLYGTTQNGGSNGYGTIFQISANGSFTPLYVFTNGIDGANPAAGLLQAADGYLYGATEYGGVYGYGTVFQIGANGSFFPLYLFTNGLDGANPAAALLQAGDGFLYGTASHGGSNGYGALFQISAGGAFTPLYSFTNGADGANPAAGLVQAADENLYGTASNGGSNGYGTVFQIGASGSFTPLYSFTGGNDGGHPSSPLVQATDGRLYGATLNGGNHGYGTVFQISPQGALHVLYSFTGGNDGGNCYAGLIQTGDGYLYGTTEHGGTYGNGTVFRIGPNGSFTSLCSFTGGDDGGHPIAGLLQTTDGSLCGTAWDGGTNGSGAIFMLDSLQVTPRILPFLAPSDGPIPATNLTLINLQGAALNWSVSNTPWLSVSPSNGVLAPNAAVSVTMSATPAAASLQPGYYPLMLDFTNVDRGQAQSIQVHYQALLPPFASFPGSDGANPNAPLLLAGDGNFYGTTAAGGTYGQGTVFQISPNGATQVLYSFTGGNDGGNSYAGLIQAGDGCLYGATEYGGTNGDGTVFQITTNGSFTSLYSFTGAEDGGNPTAGLIQASDGGLYGTAAGGNYYGTVFRVTTNGAFSLIYSFAGVDDGAFPEAALIQTSDGYLYGTANQGGSNGLGAVFRLTTNGDFHALFSFNGTDGSFPAAPLVQASDGFLYGTTFTGGNNNGSDAGIVFRISTNGPFNPVYLFTGGSDGSHPKAGLIQASDGFLYGTATAGGTNGKGTVFQISTNGSFAFAYSFAGGSDGAVPNAALIQAGDGSLYGTASAGGTNGDGTVFKFLSQGPFLPLHSFTGALQLHPIGSLLMSGGNFFGTTQSGGTSGDGTVFEVTANGALGTLASLSSQVGSEPEAGVIQAANGFLYGTAQYGGAYDDGAIFQISPGGTLSLLYSFDSFDNSSGIYPVAGLLQAGNRALYGATEYGGANGGYGTVFQFTTNGAFSVLHSFDYSDGSYPVATLLQAGNGYLYGTTESGGAFGDGTVFQITTGGSFTLLHSFDYSDGSLPQGALLQAANGALYGLTTTGGTYGHGTVFQISVAGALVTLYSFTGADDGGNPTAGLVQAANGNLYGATSSGGFSGFGAVFQITVGGAFTSLYSFSGGSDGGDPAGGLVVSDGYLYGIAQSGGANGNGCVFALLIPSSAVAPVTIGPPMLSNGNLIFSFPTTSSQSYTLQQSTNLAGSNWLFYTNFSGNGSPFLLTVPAGNLPAAFFRVSEP